MTELHPDEASTPEAASVEAAKLLAATISGAHASSPQNDDYGESIKTAVEAIDHHSVFDVVE